MGNLNAHRPLMGDFKVQYQLGFGLDPHAIVIDLFAGGGGASTGLELGLQRPVFAAINHNPKAIAMHSVNHPHTKHFIQDVFAVDPLEVTQGRPVGWMHASPDCFPAGSMILTNTGYRPIESLIKGDTVLTHKGRWRTVTAVMTAQKKLIAIQGFGHPAELLVSEEHPFFVKQRTYRIQDIRTKNAPIFSEAAWKTAANLQPMPQGEVVTQETLIADYWSSPTRIDALTRPAFPSQALGLSDENLLWRAGQYVGNGYRQTCDRDQRLMTWLNAEFGCDESSNHIPAWLYGESIELRQAWLAGFMAAGNNQHTSLLHEQKICKSQLSSKAMAFGLKTLLCTLGYSPTMYNFPHGQDSYLVRWQDQKDFNPLQVFADNDHFWSPIFSKSKPTDSTHTVYNISVEEDESYVVNSIVTHNCTHHSQAAGGQPRSKEIRDLSWVVTKYAGIVKPTLISLENVKQIQNWGPLIAKRCKKTGRVIKCDLSVAQKGEYVPRHEQFLVPDPKRKGKTWRQFIQSLKDLGYQVESWVSKACDNGAPTTRERLYMIARRDGLPIVKPKATYAKNPVLRQKVWRSAAECIDFSDTGKSIFGRKKPLAEATQTRIAWGLYRYVIEAIEPFIITNTTGSRPHPVSEPLSTITSACNQMLATPVLVPIGGSHHEPEIINAAYMMQCNGGFNKTLGTDLRQPLSTITNTGSQQQLVTATLIKAIKEPLDQHCFFSQLTPEHQEGAEKVAAFLINYYGNGDARDIRLPLDTVTTRDRLALVVVVLKGWPYVIVDIKIRMLTPRELYRAQGFPDSYVIDRGIDGKPLTKAEQVHMCGNSVSPPAMRALAEANNPWAYAA